MKENKIFFATTNEGKLREAREILGTGIEALDLKVDEIQTLDPIECVEKKAEAAYALAQRPILVEDTSLFFDAWHGLPGVFVDYFLKTLDNDGLVKLLKAETNRKARAQTSLCYFDGTKKITTTGVVEGTVAAKPKGTNGFGWDCIFIPQATPKRLLRWILQPRTPSLCEK
jgi:non-canonical purine NTP pyrophosphatase (RdgB/HAM1 family)